MNLQLQFYTFKSASSLCSYVVIFLFSCSFYCLWTHRPFLPSSLYTVCYFEKLYAVSQAVFTCTRNIFFTHTYTHTTPLHAPPPPPLCLASLCLIPSLVCGIPSSCGCPPGLGWHRLQGPGHIWSLREGKAHEALRARGKLETVMNRTIAGGRTDTKGFSVQRICPSKLLMK